MFDYSYIKDNSSSSYDDVILDLQQHLDRLIPFICEDMSTTDINLAHPALQVTTWN